MNNELIINDKDAFTTWGIVLEEASFSELLKPAPLKPFAFNKSPQMHGKDVISETSYLFEGEVLKESLARVDERNLQLPLIMYASSKEQFLHRYKSFVQELQKGVLKVEVKPLEMTLQLIYVNCQQFKSFNSRLSKFILAVNEPNPKNRS